jgi:lantibiotic transport system permease protein
MNRTFPVEWLKLKRSRIGFILAALPALSLLIASANFYANRSVLENGWYSLWSQASLFYGTFFLPVLIAICCAFVCRLEHQNRKWNMVLAAPVSAANVFGAKLAVVGLLILFAQAFFMLLYGLAGLAFTLGSFPGETLGWALRGWYASLPIAAFQLLLSMRIRSFAAPVGLGLCAVLAGLGFYVAKLGLFFPFSLLAIGMSSLNQEPLSGGENFLFWLMATGFTLLFTSLTVHRMKNKDVSAGS